MKNLLKRFLKFVVRLISGLLSLPGSGFRWYFSCRMAVRVVLTVVLLLLLAAAISAGNIYLMFRRHFTVPFEAMGLSDDYRPGFAFDANHTRSVKRFVRGQKPEDDPR